MVEFWLHGIVWAEGSEIWTTESVEKVLSGNILSSKRTDICTVVTLAIINIDSEMLITDSANATNIQL